MAGGTLLSLLIFVFLIVDDYDEQVCVDDVHYYKRAPFCLTQACPFSHLSARLTSATVHRLLTCCVVRCVHSFICGPVRLDVAVASVHCCEPLDHSCPSSTRVSHQTESNSQYLTQPLHEKKQNKKKQVKGEKLKAIQQKYLPICVVCSLVAPITAVSAGNLGYDWPGFTGEFDSVGVLVAGQKVSTDLPDLSLVFSVLCRTHVLVPLL